MGTAQKRGAWNKSKMTGPKPPLKPRDNWAAASRKQTWQAMAMPLFIQAGCSDE